MKRWIIPAGILAAAFGLLGCGNRNGQSESSAKAEAPAATEAVAVAETAAMPMKVDGYQVVRVIVRNTGFEPARIELQAGVPAKFVFVQEGDSHCAAQVQIPELGVPTTDLPEGQETVVEFSPEQAGTYTFTCGMNMMKGTILVSS